MKALQRKILILVVSSVLISALFITTIAFFTMVVSLKVIQEKSCNLCVWKQGNLCRECQDIVQADEKQREIQFYSRSHRYK